MGQKLFSLLLVLTPSVALGVAALGLIGFILDRPARPGVTVPDSVRDLGVRPAGPEFPVTISVHNNTHHRWRIIGVGGPACWENSRFRVEQAFPVDIDPSGIAEVTLWLRVTAVSAFEAAPVVFVDENGARGIPVILRGRGVDPPSP